MAVVPVLPTATTGVYTSSQISQLIAAINFAMNPPIARLRQAVAQNLTDTVPAVITFDTEEFDLFPSGGAKGHSTSVNTSRYTAVFPGYYEVSGGVTFAASAAGVRVVRWLVNGASLTDSDVLLTPVTGNTTRIPTRTHEVYLNVGDYAELQVVQTSGGALLTSVSAAGEQSSMCVRWVHA